MRRDCETLETNKESAQCQTPWTDLLNFVENSGTQTNESEIFSDTTMPMYETQTMQTSSFEDFVVTDSFTQTSLDQNTQTQPFDVDTLFMN